jgi:hypothetical protein
MKFGKRFALLAIAGAAICATPVIAQDFGSSPIERGELRMMDGKDVFGANRVFLGTVIGVDLNRNLAELQLPTDVAISVDADRLVDRGDHVMAPSLTRGDTLAMSRAQNGNAAAEDLGVIPSFDED